MDGTEGCWFGGRAGTRIVWTAEGGVSSVSHRLIEAKRECSYVGAHSRTHW